MNFQFSVSVERKTALYSNKDSPESTECSIPELPGGS